MKERDAIIAQNAIVFRDMHLQFADYFLYCYAPALLINFQIYRWRRSQDPGYVAAFCAMYTTFSDLKVKSSRMVVDLSGPCRWTLDNVYMEVRHRARRHAKVPSTL